MHSRIIFTWKLTSNRHKQHSSALTCRSIIVKLKAKKKKKKRKQMGIFAPESVRISVCVGQKKKKTCQKTLFLLLHRMAVGVGNIYEHVVIVIFGHD